MKKWTMIIDVALCENCNNCFLACKDEHCGNEWPGYATAQPLHGQRWMNILRRERGQFPLIDVAYLSKPCQHCDDPPCMRGAQHQAVFKRPDGIVLIDPEKAKGQRDIVQACPFGAVWWNEEKQVPQKCTLCAHLLDEGWKAPRCVQACPTGALTIMSLDDQERAQLIESEGLEVLHPAKPAAKPGVYYKNLYRFETCFISGSVATGQDAVSDCVDGAAVKLYQDQHMIAQTVTDVFGDYKFDGLPAGSGPYRVEIEYQDADPRTIDGIELVESRSLGTVWL